MSAVEEPHANLRIPCKHTPDARKHWQRYCQSATATAQRQHPADATLDRKQPEPPRSRAARAGHLYRLTNSLYRLIGLVDSHIGLKCRFGRLQLL